MQPRFQFDYLCSQVFDDTRVQRPVMRYAFPDVVSVYDRYWLDFNSTGNISVLRYWPLSFCLAAYAHALTVIPAAVNSVPIFPA